MDGEQKRRERGLCVCEVSRVSGAAQANGRARQQTTVSERRRVSVPCAFNFSISGTRPEDTSPSAVSTPLLLDARPAQATTYAFAS